jgi:hypothetical protein
MLYFIFFILHFIYIFLIPKIPVSGTVELDESKLLEYIDYQVAKGFSKIDKGKTNCMH